MEVRIRGRRPTIPEYYRDFIDKNVDLTESPKQCCPFHQEDTPSFSYSADKNVWRCFGGCHTGGDVVDLHRINYHLNSREEALKSLNAIYGVIERVELKSVNNNLVDEDKIESNTAYAKALILADRPERWLELDYVMSKYPVSTIELNELVHKWA